MANNEVYNLRWNDYQSTLSDSVGTLLDDSDFIDVTLACEGQSFSAHKVVLSACSSYLKKLLKRNPCKHPIIILKDIKAQVLHSLVQFMYHGAVDVPEEMLSDFLSSAQALEVRGLAEDDVPKPQHHRPEPVARFTKRQETFQPIQKKPRLSEPSLYNQRSQAPSPRNAHVVSAERARSMVKSGAFDPVPKNSESELMRKFSSKEVSITPAGSSGASSRDASAFQTDSDSNLEPKEEETVKVKQEEYESDLEVMDPEMSLPGDSDVGGIGFDDSQRSFSDLQQEFGDGSAGPSQVPMMLEGASMGPEGPMPMQKSIPCPYCGKLFPQRNRLLAHIERVHEVRRKEDWEKCTLCSKTFKTRDYLVRHLNQAHKIYLRTERKGHYSQNPPPPPFPR